MFIFKKIVSNFFFPLPLVLILLFIALIFFWTSGKWKKGKALATISFILLLLFSNNTFSDLIVAPLESRYAPHSIQLASHNKAPSLPPVKYIVVLGGGHISNPELPLTAQIGKDALPRLVEGVILHKKVPESRLIVSGGAIFDQVPHAEIMADIAMQLGVDKDDIIIEDRSRDTKDEALLIKSIVKDERFFLITSASHMRRSMALFKKQGMDPIPAPTAHLAISSVGPKPGYIFPNVNALYKSTRAFYEYTGIAWAALRGQI